MAKAAKGRISVESFDDFLLELNPLVEAEDVSIKRVLAWLNAKAKKAKSVTNLPE